MTVHVVGSGPAGVACASALLDRGLDVVLLDAGIRLEPSRAEQVEEMKGLQPSQWSASQIAFLKENMSATAKGIPLKYVYGSDFPYRQAEQAINCHNEGTGLAPSFAEGGLSNVWGSAMLPYSEEDLKTWPVSASDLAPSYQAILKLTGLSAGDDALKKFFPLFTEDFGRLELSSQARIFRDQLDRHGPALQSRGIYHGSSRIAMQAPVNGTPGCCYCGMCMYGCPYGFIYNSASTVRQWAGRPGFQYRPDFIVDRLEETADGGGVKISGRNRQTGESLEVDSARVFLASGVIPTTRILLESLGAYDQKLTIQDSQYFLFPLVLAKGAARVREESLQSLSQLFLEIDDREISPHLVHLQIYSYNDLVGQAVRNSLGPLAAIEPLAQALEGRLLIAQGYLHSDHSSGIGVTLESGGKLRLVPENNPATRKSVQKVIGKLLKETLRLKALPLAPMVQIAPVGRGFHSGGSFPMKTAPGRFESDLLGRPTGFSRVHIADATCFPNIPATTITMSAMANAHRIGHLAPA